MSDLPQFTLPNLDGPLPAVPSSRGPAASPSAVDPQRWEDGEGFRETFLVLVSEPGFNMALRVVGAMLYDMSLEFCRHWPYHAEGETRAQLRAAIADMRHLEGFLTTYARGPQDFQLSEPERHLCDFAGERIPTLRAIADDLEKELGPWRG